MYTTIFFSARWDYFIKDCVWSGITKEETQRDIQLVSENCVNKEQGF